MNRKWILFATIAVLGAAVSLNLAVSCGDDHTGGDADAADDGTGRIENDLTDGVTADFVIDTMRIGGIDAGEGFNLDGINTGPGQPMPEDGPGGVDNQLGALIQALQDAGLDFNADEDIQAGIDEGSLLILIRHVDVDSWTNDPGLVHLLGYAGKDPDDNPENNLTGSGEILVDELSLTDPEDLDASLIHFENGVLEDTTAADTVWQEGDFEAGPALFRVDIPIQDSILTLSVNGTRIVWDLEDAPAGDPALGGALKNGLLGGYVYLGDAARALSQIDLSGASIDADTIRTILAGQADMDVIGEGFDGDNTCDVSTYVTDCAPGQTCEQDAARGGGWYCWEPEENLDAISLAIVFSAVSCEITGIYHEPVETDADADGDGGDVADVPDEVVQDAGDVAPEAGEDAAPEAGEDAAPEAGEDAADDPGAE